MVSLQDAPLELLGVERVVEEAVAEPLELGVCVQGVELQVVELQLDIVQL